MKRRREGDESPEEGEITDGSSPKRSRRTTPQPSATRRSISPRPGPSQAQSRDRWGSSITTRRRDDRSISPRPGPSQARDRSRSPLRTRRDERSQQTTRRPPSPLRTVESRRPKRIRFRHAAPLPIPTASQTAPRYAIVSKAEVRKNPLADLPSYNINNLVENTKIFIKLTDSMGYRWLLLTRPGYIENPELEKLDELADKVRDKAKRFFQDLENKLQDARERGLRKLIELIEKYRDTYEVNFIRSPEIIKDRLSYFQWSGTRFAYEWALLLYIDERIEDLNYRLRRTEGISESEDLPGQVITEGTEEVIEIPAPTSTLESRLPNYIRRNEEAFAAQVDLFSSLSNHQFRLQQHLALGSERGSQRQQWLGDIDEAIDTLNEIENQVSTIQNQTRDIERRLNDDVPGVSVDEENDIRMRLEAVEDSLHHISELNENLNRDAARPMV